MTIFLDEAMELDLRVWAQREGRSIGSIIRQAIERELSERSSPESLIGFIAAGRSGRTDIAERHEEFLWRPARGASDFAQDSTSEPGEAVLPRSAGARRS